MDRVTMVVPSIAKDVIKLNSHYNELFRFLPVDKICVIGGLDVESLLPEDKRITFINESQLIDYEKIKSTVIKKAGVEAAGRTGWYVQQFVKMAYSRVCKDKYYLLWDSDTVPLKTVDMFSDGKPYFDCKTEFHEPYFKTISRIFTDLKKNCDSSFISEHMMINVSIMNEMLDEIESNVSLEGDNFAEKILSAIDQEDIGQSGFSEFETYGTYTHGRHHGMYQLRSWKSLRFGSFFYKESKGLTESDIEWLREAYDAISFEKGDYLSPVSKLVEKNLYKKIFPASSLETISVLIRGYRKIIGKR